MQLYWRLLEYIQQGGWIMIPLGMASVAMWFLIAERWLAFRRLDRSDMKIQDAVHAVQGRPFEEESGTGLRAILVRSFISARTGDVELDKQILRQKAMEIRPELSRFVALVAVLAAIAPLLGLLGTVIGMIETFQVISLFGTGNAKALAGGISVALITTQSGLLVAIPGLLMSAALSRKANKLRHDLDEITVVLANHLVTGSPTAKSA